MTSLWLDQFRSVVDDILPDESLIDDLVVGAGLTGLTTALLLSRAGRRVAVIEARTVGAVATGNTTAKLSLLQGTRLSTILGRQSHRVAAAYVDANREGQQWLIRFCADHGVSTQTRDAITYAAEPSELRAARQEFEAARALGLDVRWEDALDVPFPNHGAVLLPGQAQFDPMDVLVALVEQIREHGGTVHQGLRVVKVSRSGRPRVELDDGTTLRADTVVLATGSPMLDRGLYFAKLHAQRSYALAYELPGVAPGMYLSAGSSLRSIRDAPRRGGAARLVVGGSGHPVGRTDSELAHLDELRGWAARYFPGAVETHAWSAQDYESHDGIPYVGRLPRGGGRIYVATGFAKWGMTNGVAAARSISAEILGRPTSWSRVLGGRVTRRSGIADGASINLGVGLAAILSLVRAESRSAPGSPPEGSGDVGRGPVLPTGVSTIDGTTCSVLALCTHLGGVLSWNDAERTWDCPLHGSRFAPDGHVLEGPAVRPLAVRE